MDKRALHKELASRVAGEKGDKRKILRVKPKLYGDVNE